MGQGHCSIGYKKIFKENGVIRSNHIQQHWGSQESGWPTIQHCRAAAGCLAFPTGAQWLHPLPALLPSIPGKSCPQLLHIPFGCSVPPWGWRLSLASGSPPVHPALNFDGSSWSWLNFSTFFTSGDLKGWGIVTSVIFRISNLYFKYYLINAHCPGGPKPAKRRTSHRGKQGWVTMKQNRHTCYLSFLLILHPNLHLKQRVKERIE